MLLGLAFKARVLILHAENMQRTVINVFLWHQYTACLSYSEAFLGKGTKRLLLTLWNILLIPILKLSKVETCKFTIL